MGVLVVTVLNMLTRTRKRVTSSAILPGITSMGIRNEIQETITNIPEHIDSNDKGAASKDLTRPISIYTQNNPFGYSPKKQWIWF